MSLRVVRTKKGGKMGGKEQRGVVIQVVRRVVNEKVGGKKGGTEKAKVVRKRVVRSFSGR